MALLLDIPMPYCGICEVDSNTLFDGGIISSNNYGYAFYSTYMPKATKLVPTVIKLIKNKDVFTKILLFDNIIFNKDRNTGNLLVQYYKNDVSLKVIDHTHVFINGAIWDAARLRFAMDENDLLSLEVLEYNSTLYNMFYNNVTLTSEILNQASAKFKGKIKAHAIRNAIDECPKEWRPQKDDENTLIEYLMYRLNNIHIITTTILNYLKKQRGII